MSRPPHARVPRRAAPPAHPLPAATASVRPAVAVAVLALALAGCGGSDASGGGTTRTGSPGSVAAPVPSTGTATGAPGASGTPGGAAGGGDTGAAGDGGTGDAEPTAGTTSPFAETYDVTVTGRRVSPEPTAVDLAVGETLLLRVTADAGSEVHAHGFGDLSVPVSPGQPVEVQLTGTEPGLFEVELHDPDLLLLQVAVR